MQTVFMMLSAVALLCVALYGLYADISTCVAYFGTHNNTWGIVCCMTLCFGYVVASLATCWIGAHESSGDAETPVKPSLTHWRSQILHYRCTHFVLALLGLSSLTPTIDSSLSNASNEFGRIHSNDSTSSEDVEWLHTADERDNLSNTVFFEQQSAIVDAVIWLKTLVIACLHAYVMLANQLDAQYETKRLHGLSLANQFGSLCVACAALVFTLHFKLRDADHSTSSTLTNIRLIGYWLATVWLFVSLSVFAASFHAWVCLLGIGVLLGSLVIWERMSRARHQPVPSARLVTGFLHRMIPLLLTLVVVAGPFVLPFIASSGRFVHVHGVCHSGRGVVDGQNCFPVALLYLVFGPPAFAAIAQFVIAVIALVQDCCQCTSGTLSIEEGEANLKLAIIA